MGKLKAFYAFIVNSRNRLSIILYILGWYAVGWICLPTESWIGIDFILLHATFSLGLFCYMLYQIEKVFSKIRIWDIISNNLLYKIIYLIHIIPIAILTLLILLLTVIGLFLGCFLYVYVLIS